MSRRTPGGQAPRDRRGHGRSREHRHETSQPRLRRRQIARRTSIGHSGRLRRRTSRRVTGRLAILALVFALLLLTLTYPFRQYLAQREHITQLEQSQEAQRQRIKALAERREKWQDPAYIKSQSRIRLQYVEDGEVAYLIIEDPALAAQAEAEAKKASNGRKLGKAVDRGAWYNRLWSTVQAADHPATTVGR